LKTFFLEKDRGTLLLSATQEQGETLLSTLLSKKFNWKSTKEINSKRFVELDLIALAADIESFEQSEKVIATCFNEAQRAGNVVLIINDFIISSEERKKLV